LFAYLLTTPDLDKRFQVYNKTPWFLEEPSGYALNLGITTKEELVTWGRNFNSCLVIADNTLIAKAIALYKNRPGLFWVKDKEAFYKLPVNFLWPIPEKILTEFYQTGFKTIGSLKQIPLESLKLRLGEIGERTYHYCRGRSDQIIPLTVPFFEKHLKQKDWPKALLLLYESLPSTANLWISSLEKSIEIKQNKIGIKTLERTLKTLWPWQSLIAIIWDSPLPSQKSLFDFSLPNVLEDLVETETNLKIGFTISRREQVRCANFLWGFK
jgi:hypothetical protein